MILRPIRWAVSAFITFVVAWFVFMVPLGEYTLFQHMRRIAATDEARVLGDEVGGASERLRSEVVRQVGESLTPDGGQDAAR